ncbi:MAG: ATP-binding protein [Nanoarchaeota archaeon]
MFVNRKNELEMLEERKSSGKAEFLVIYGRRRVGKSELIDKFLEKQTGIRLLAREETKLLQLRNFSEKLADFFHDEVLAKSPFSGWDAFFEYLAQKSDKRLIIAIDEFPYLVKEDASLPSILQDYWDNKLRKTGIFLILCGSSMTMMERLLGYKSPLYGRRTGQLLIRPFSFAETLEYESDMQKAIEMFSVFGGTPAYLNEYDSTKALLENISKIVMKEDSFIYRDIEFIIREELREPRYYFSILLSISKGKTTIGEIMNDTGLDKSIVGKYLSILADLHFIIRNVPATENIMKSKRGIYLLSDNMFKFWFRYIYPYKEFIEKNQQAFVADNFIKPEFNEYVSLVFEDICREAVQIMNSKKILPAVFSKIDRQWGRISGRPAGESQYEIDIVALGEKTKDILFAECKWQDKVNAAKIFEELKKKAEFVDWNIGKRNEYFAIFARSFAEKPKVNGLMLFDLGDLEKLFRQK